MNYYLMCHDQPPTIVYDEDKDRYYQALHAYDADEDLKPLQLFLQEQTVKTWEKTLRRQVGA
jgi:hypothetical protein